MSRAEASHRASNAFESEFPLRIFPAIKRRVDIGRSVEIGRLLVSIGPDELRNLFTVFDLPQLENTLAPLSLMFPAE